MKEFHHKHMFGKVLDIKCNEDYIKEDIYNRTLSICGINQTLNFQDLILMISELGRIVSFEMVEIA